MGPSLSRSEQQKFERMASSQELRCFGSEGEQYVQRILPAFFKRNGRLLHISMVRFWKSATKAAHLRALLELLFSDEDPLLRLENFALAYCHGPTLDAFFETADLSSLTGVTSVSFVGCSLTSQMALARILEPVGPVLARLDLRGNFFECLPAESIRACCRSLVRLNLQGLMLPPELNLFAPVEQKQKQRHKQQQQQQQRDGKDIDDDDDLPEEVIPWSRLKFVNVSENRFEELNLESLPSNGRLEQLLAHHNHLHTLKFRDDVFPATFVSLVVAMNDLSWRKEGGPAAAPGLCRSLFTNHASLSQVSLHENNLDGEFRLRNLPRLTDLGVASNQLSRVVIVDCPQLTRLDVSGNIVLSTLLGLDECEQLEELLAGVNSLSEEILLQIQDLPRLQKVFLGYNRISFIPEDWFASMKYLVFLDLSGNGLGPIPAEGVCRMGSGKDGHIMSSVILFWGDNDPECWDWEDQQTMTPPDTSSLVAGGRSRKTGKGKNGRKKKKLPSKRAQKKKRKRREQRMLRSASSGSLVGEQSSDSAVAVASSSATPLLSCEFPMRRLNSGLKRVMFWGNMNMLNSVQALEEARRQVAGPDNCCSIEMSRAPIPTDLPSQRDVEEQEEEQEEEGEQQGQQQVQQQPSSLNSNASSNSTDDNVHQWGTFTVSQGEADREVRFGFGSTKGPYRPTMEDAHSYMELEIPIDGVPAGDEDEIDVILAQFLGVFDGHAGSLTSVMCARELPHLLENALAGIDFDSNQQITDAVILAIDHLDNLLRRRKVTDGTTMIAALFLESKLVIINIGDSRAVVVTEDGSLEALSTDHKANSYEEQCILKEREDVIVDSRVNGQIAVVRSLGDFASNLSHAPEIRILELEELRPRLLVLACDGLWDVMTNEMLGHILETMWPTEICDPIHEKVEGGAVRWMAWRLINMSLSANSRDNVSTLVMEFQDE